MTIFPTVQQEANTPIVRLLLPLDPVDHTVVPRSHYSFVTRLLKNAW